MKLHKNIGQNDSKLRTVAAVAIILLAMFFVENPYVKILLALVSAALAATAYFHSCYLYKLLGLHTLNGKVAHTEETAPSVQPEEKTQPSDMVAEERETPESEKVA